MVITSNQVVLVLPMTDVTALDGLVVECLAAGIGMLMIWGPGAWRIAGEVRAIADQAAVEHMFLIEHRDDGPLEEAVEVARAWDSTGPSPQIVRL